MTEEGKLYKQTFTRFERVIKKKTLLQRDLVQRAAQYPLYMITHIFCSFHK